MYLLSLDDSYFMAITLPSMRRPLVKLQSWMLDFDHKQSSHMNGSGMGRKPTQKQRNVMRQKKEWIEDAELS